MSRDPLSLPSYNVVAKTFVGIFVPFAPCLEPAAGSVQPAPSRIYSNVKATRNGAERVSPVTYSMRSTPLRGVSRGRVLT